VSGSDRKKAGASLKKKTTKKKTFSAMFLTLSCTIGIAHVEEV
jgi:hypothetical protein